MKTKFILFFMLFFSATIFAQEVKRVAILETVDKEDQVAYAYEALLRRNLSKAITNISGYEVYDRTDIDAIMSEQSFQRTGLVSNDQIKRLGEMTGASYILVAEVAMAKEDVLIFAKLLDVETARIIMDDLETTTLDNIQSACEKLAKRMFHEEVKEEVKIDTNCELIRHTAQEQKIFGVKKYSYGTTQMDEKAFRAFLYKNNRELYLKYMKDRSLIYAGWGTCVGGLILGGVGTSLLYVDDGIIGAILLMPIGYGAALAGIPVLSVGYARHKKDAIKMFNEQDTKQPAVTLSVQSNQNGIGLALNF